MILRTNFDGDSNIGLYSFATEKYCILGKKTGLKKEISEELKAPIISTTMMNTDFCGIFSAGNSYGIIVSSILEDEELSFLMKELDIVLVLDTNFAIGNLVLMNDNGIIISPTIRKFKNKIESFFGLPTAVTKIAGIGVVGSVGFATNKGCLAHPHIKKAEINIIKRILGVNVDIGTVSYGSPFPKSGIIANSKGIVVSESSSGPELGRITEALGFVG